MAIPLANILEELPSLLRHSGGKWDTEHAGAPGVFVNVRTVGSFVQFLSRSHFEGLGFRVWALGFRFSV